MKAKLNFHLTLVLSMLLSLGVTYAQSKQIKGVVTDQSGLPLLGATVIVQGTTNGTSTDFDGKYVITAELNDILVFSSVGYEDKKVTVGSSDTINVTLEEGTLLDAVVITALGITRDEKSLGYSAQSVSGEDLSATRSSNALSSLSGNVAGVQITAPSSSLGGSTRILMRGVTSLTGENRPLVVIDGTPMSNQNYNSSGTQRGSGGRDYGDMAFDVNPDNIESINVLKGGPAAALYGSRGANGVIMITTKSGKAGRDEITVNSGISFDQISIFPNLQKKYGGGSGDFSKQVINGTEYNLVDYGADENWGPKYDPNLMVLQWNAFDAEDFPDDYLNPTPWMYPKNDKKSFFNTGISTTNSVSFSKSYESTTARVSLSHVDQKGIVPNSSLRKVNAALALENKFSDKLTASGNISYTRTDGFNRPEVGYGDVSIGQQFFQWMQNSLDLNALKDYKLSDGTQRTWNRTSYRDGTPVFTDNPYWMIHENTSQDTRNRFFGNVSLKYDINEDLYASASIYGDHYDFSIRDHTAVGSAQMPHFAMTNYNFTEMNYEGRLHYNKQFEDFSLNSFVGVNRMHSKQAALSGSTSGGLVVPEIYNLGNSVEKANVSNSDSGKRINSLFGGVSVGWRNLIFVDLTARNDWSSTLPSGENSYFYPGVTGSFIFSELIDEVDWINYAKVRGGYSQVRNDTSPYQLKNTYTGAGISSDFLGNPGFTNSTTLRNAELKPEKVTTWEVGLEGVLLDSRLSFDITYYNKTTDELIVPVQITPSSGYSYVNLNAGSMENKGIEAMISGTPISTEDFEWTVSWNFAKNTNEVTDLYGDLESINIGSAPFGVRLEAMLGEKYGQIRGTDFVYDNQGNKVVNSNGLYLSSPVKSLGSVMPDYNMGIRNSFRYKNFRLSALIDIQKGGKYFSTSHMFGHYTGTFEATAAGSIREDGIIVDGVTGTVTYDNDGNYTVTDVAANTAVTDAQSYFGHYYSGPDATNVFDADYIKLREISLAYNFPTDKIGPLAQLEVSVFGRNLFAWGLDNKDFDPEMASSGSGNIQGIEGGNLPPTRSMGMNLKMRF